MRSGVVQRVVSRLLWFTAVALCPPWLIALAGDEPRSWAWLVAIAAAGSIAYGIRRMPAARAAPGNSLRRRESFLAVTLGWLLIVTFTAAAYALTGQFAGFAECFFESMSGFTTTGATVVTDVEALPASVLFMRSFSHWIGGMGIIVLSVAILPELAVGGMQMFAAEASGIDSDKLAPRIAATARRLWVLYLAITVVEAVLLLASMGPFDAINHAMATIATGGFSTRNTSVAGFDSLYVELVILVFMWISGISFSLQYRAIFQGRIGRLWGSPEVRLYAYLTAGGIALVTLDIWAAGIYDLPDALRYSSFQTVALITTTGFGTADFDMWPDFSRVLLVGIMLIGGCAGSTAGGSKVVRLYVVVKHAMIQLRRLIHPRVVSTLHIGDRDVPRETTEGILGYYLLFFASMMVMGLAMTALGLDLVSGMTASVSAMNSIGPGLGTVGATQNFGDVPAAGLYLLSGGMLLGRLEIYPLLVLLTVQFWRRS